MGARLIQAIETTVSRGRGVAGDPVREVVQYYSPKGELLAEKDPCPIPPELVHLVKEIDHIDALVRFVQENARYFTLRLSGPLGASAFEVAREELWQVVKRQKHAREFGEAEGN
jgi:hypothetical protein